MTESESYNYNLCDAHEWAGLGFCPKCRKEIQREARKTANLAKKLGWPTIKWKKPSGDSTP